jgi:glutamate synthase domain-containing protein 3
MSPPAESGPIVGRLRVTPPVSTDGDTVVIDCQGVYFTYVNEAVRGAFERGATTVKLINVVGQRYIGTGLRGDARRIEVHGTPGQDVAMFMNGPTVEVFGNAKDGCGNTMTSGTVIVHGSAGDVAGYGMRGGRVFVRGDVGYRAGIHMKAREGLCPVMVCGGEARDFCGEYMAGGLLVVLGMDSPLERRIVGDFLGTGMHGGELYVRGDVDPWQCGSDVLVAPASDHEMVALEPTLADFCAVFAVSLADVLSVSFTRVTPRSSRPYGDRYTYL